MKKLLAILIVLMLFVFTLTIEVNAVDVPIEEPAVAVEDGPLNSFWDAVQSFISSPSWGTLAAVGSALLVIATPFIWFFVKKKLTTVTTKLKAKYEYAKAEAGNYKKLYKAYKQDQEVTREKINALFDGFAVMVDAMNLRIDYKDKISNTLSTAKVLTVEPIELEPVADIEPEDYEDEEFDAVEENTTVGW